MSDTIAAISTAMTSSAGIGIVRMSGNEAVSIADKVFHARSGGSLADMPSHTIHYGYVCDGDKVIDEVLLMLMKAPATYTREDTVEIDCHGGILVQKTILDLLLRSGARPAEPGEFTKRAFLNGRIDLSQAEAVMDVISSQSRIALETSVNQLRGSLRNRIQALRRDILHDTSWIEASLDDPEHISSDEIIPHIRKDTEKWIGELKNILSRAHDGQILREGIRTVIIGKPNAGKSSLMNVLLGRDRAIVSDIAGTTRDTIEEQLTVGGIPLIVVDTAGIRRTDDAVEKIGVDRARNITKDADLIVYVVDSSTKLDRNDQDILELVRGRKVIVLLNKSDLPAQTSPEDVKKLIDAPIVPVSAKEETGIEEFSNVIKGMFFSGDISYNNEVFITNARQMSALQDALGSIGLVRQSIEDGMPEDMYTIDLMDAYDKLGMIIGESAGEDLIDEIFGSFCMGK